MEISWADIWELFHYAILSSLIAGIVCPLVGVFLLVRRTGFYGVALPQFAATGVAFGWAIPVWLGAAGLVSLDIEAASYTAPHAVKNYLLACAGVFTFSGLGILLATGRVKETETGRVAAAFAIASALTVLLAMVSPHGSEMIEQLLRGEILTADLHEFETIAIVYGLVLLAIVVFHHDLLLTSFDRDLALVEGKSVRRIEALLLFLTGLTVSVGVLIVGPVVLFGLLVIPPLAARSLARSMLSFYLWAAGLGALSVLLGIVASFAFDLPLGPALVAVAAVESVPVWLFGRLRGQTS